MTLLLKFGTYVGLVLFYFNVIHSDGRWDKFPEETLVNAFIKVLPVASLLVFTFTTGVKDAVHAHLKQNILQGLLFSLFGDICMIWKVDLLLPGMVFFALAHCFYIRAFTFRPFGDLKTALTCVVPGIIAFLVLLLPNIEHTSHKVVGSIYSTLISIMWWRSVVHFRSRPTGNNMCACAGAFIFMTSDFIISLDTWVFRFPYASLLIMATYYAAQFAIATVVLSYTAF